MRILNLIPALIASMVFPAAHAQQKPGGKVTSTYTASGSADLESIVPKTVPLQKLTHAKEQLLEEEKTLNQKRQSADPLDPCAQEELTVRQKDVDFVKQHGDQIQDIANQLKVTGTKISRFLREAGEGRIGSQKQEEYTNATGEKDRSAMIRFEETGADGEPRTKVIAVKDLIRFIQKYEAEIQALPDADDAAAVDNVMKKFNDPKNESNPEYFNMTLAQAARAFSRNLNSVLALEQSGLVTYSLQIGKGRQLFQVGSTISLGQSVKYRTQVGMLSLKGASSGISFVESVRACIERNRNEDQYWSVIRSQQITIDGVPIDGGLRRQFFEQLRSEKCRAKTYTFDTSKTSPGPWVSFDSRTPCDKKGIQISSATFQKNADYKVGSTVKRGHTVNVTDLLAAEANNSESYRTKGTLGDVLSSTGLGYNDGGVLTVRYRCACEAKDREFSHHYKLSMTISIGCN